VAIPADIDRLIEEGLNRYGSGDLDGALRLWEQVLVLEPDNPQANSYVDYVRLNYEILQTDGGPNVVVDNAFGIEDEPEYIIEISGGEIRAGDAPMYMDPSDEGWFIEEQTRERGTGEPVIEVRTISADLPPKHFEIEAEEPPELELVPLVPSRAPSGNEISFDAATREYGSDERPRVPGVTPMPSNERAGTNEFEESSGGFRLEATPGFSSQIDTEVRKRDLGFVQPTAGPPPPAKLEVRVRTPSASSPPQRTMPIAAPPHDDLELGTAGRHASSELGKTARGLTPVPRTPAPVTGNPPLRTPTEEDLIASLPSPRKVTPLRGSGAPIVDPASRIPTRELPEKTRPPAATPTDRAETKQGDDEDIALPNASTRDLGRDLGLTSTDPAGGMNDFAISAPTRDLGLRPPDAPPRRPASVYPDEDAPTRQSDARQIRDEHSTQKLKPLKKPTGGAPDGTRQDIVLPFDPIDARTAQILEAIEPTPPPSNEPKEDRTRRRISALIDRATEWSAQGELDKAVAAVDLALSEDPNSALAQKLIHRNREAIMNIFQVFLGDLDRQPLLARPLHELASAPISPRAAFLLSRIDGTLTIDEILDVSGMPRLEAYRHLCQLFLRGILR